MPPKRRRRFQGLYYHSSPPKVLPMNGQIANSSGRRKRDPDDLSVKLSTIRIWMHEKDIGKLTRVLWAGQGTRLRQQASTNAKVKRFLAAVPYVMNSIKDVHQAVIDNNLENLQSNLEPPVPPALVTCRDANGLNLIHKAAGLGHATILEYLITTWPDGVHETDITGKTPLHWAASAKNNMRCYTLLTQAGCDEEAVDYKMKTASYYRHKPHEIERAFVTYVPETPRVSPDVATDWEALSDDSGDGKKLDIKIPEMNGFGRHSNAESNTSEAEMAEATNGHEDEDAAEDHDEMVFIEDQNGEEKAEEEARNNNETEDTKLPAGEEKQEQHDEETQEENEMEKEKDEEYEGKVENDEKEDEQEENEKAEKFRDNHAMQKEKDEPQDDEPLDETGNEKSNSSNEDEDEPLDEAGNEKSSNNEEDDEEATNEPDVRESDQDPLQEPLSETNAEEEQNKKETKEDKLDEELQVGDGGGDGDGDVGSTTSSLAIEGFVQGDAEDNTVQSQKAAYVDDNEETRLQNIIASGDMEQLAQIVLNGDGHKLLNVEAKEPEIQAFLKNVPNYMGKIRNVHEAARQGSLLNLQQALDRRKFAIAKDEISPNGATPLHVAVLFGNSDIVRYLSARFPETTTITDTDGRTALHYAAVINDNGHFYNVLLQLGANPKVVDTMGYTPENYLDKKELAGTLNYAQLLKRFGAQHLEAQLLNDQGRMESQSIQENPLFKTEQGKYLADNLADPLIKALTQVAQKRPNDPLQYLANYLQSYVTSRNTNGRTITQQAAVIHSGSSKSDSTIVATSAQQILERQKSAIMNGHIDDIENDDRDKLQHLIDNDYGDNDYDDDSDSAISKKLEERDEHGQSMLHFACARSQRRGSLVRIITNSNLDITYRDELYRTARDVALQANHKDNAKDIDNYVMSLAVVGDIKPFEYLTISGYDHIIDVIDDNETPIVEVAEARGLHELATHLRTIRPLEELREELHQMIRDNNVERVKEIADSPQGKWLIKAKNYYGRTALHIAILKESIEIVEHFVNRCREALKVGDNLERTPLHYAMGTSVIESVSRILIQNGAKRTGKDLKGRQPSYYFMNKADILRLQEEEDENR